MKKKTMFMVALGAILSIGAMSYATSFKKAEHVHTHGEHEEEMMDLDVDNHSKKTLSTFSTDDGKETKYFNITTEISVQPNFSRFNFNIAGDDIPSDAWLAANFDFYYNDEKQQTTSSFLNTDGTFYFGYGDCVPSAERPDEEKMGNYYSHYQIKAGTTIFSTANANYVLEKDYNFWSTRGQNIGWAYLFQHCGNDDFRGAAAGDIPSLKFTQFGGGLQDFAKRFLFQPKYEETSASFTYSNMGWEQRCPIYIDKGDGYVLLADSNKNPIIWENGEINNAGEELLFSLYFSEAFDSSAETFSEVEMSRSYYSFYIPDGTLWGGIDHPFLIEDDYYFEITKDEVDGSYLHGFYKSEHDYIKHEAKEPTCKEDGNVEYYTCRKTHKEEQECLIKNEDGSFTATTLESVIKKADASKHVIEKVEKVEATEGHHGTKEHYECSKCGGLFSDSSGNNEVTADSLVIHDYVKHEAVAKTCDNSGNKEYYSCSACDKYFLKDEDGNYVETAWDDIEIKASHTYVEIAEVAATETKHGTKAHYKCSGCSKLFVKDGDNYVEVKEDSLVLHNLVEVKAKSSTCTEKGNKAYKKCTCEGCGKIYIENENGELVETKLDALTIPALGHRFGSWNFDETNLKITRSCQNCDQVETVDVNEENGFTYKVVVEPTTNSEGKATWSNEKYGTFTVTLPKLEKSNNTGLIIGIAAGVSVVLVGGGLALYFVLKKKKN